MKKNSGHYPGSRVKSEQPKSKTTAPKKEYDEKRARELDTYREKIRQEYDEKLARELDTYRVKIRQEYDEKLAWERDRHRAQIRQPCEACSNKDIEIGQLKTSRDKTHGELQQMKTESARKLSQQCCRSECITARKAAEQRSQGLKRMNSQPCTSQSCYGKKILGILGQHSLSEGSHELTIIKALEQLDKKVSSLVWESVGGTLGPTQEHLEQGKCRNEECLRMKRDLERKVKDLQSALHANKCQKPECTKFRRDLKQKELAETGKRGNVGTNLQKMTGSEHSELIHEFEAMTTNQDGILGELENAVGAFDAKMVLSWIFQVSYDNCKELAVRRICQKLEALFTVNKEPDREDMEDTSRGYGLLLHGAGLKTEQVTAEHVSAVTEQVYLRFTSTDFYDTLKTILQPGNPLLNHVVRLTWKFITLPSPLIICQPPTFSEQIHEPEFGHWIKSVQQAKLIYLRPVVYRSYQGTLACKAWVANTR